ncbi:GTPase Obg [Geodia barretti]|uniref:GTPase Obg n=1 Tax=Geodia barretti TaxID=519541 RepID=A0AA35XBG9_GEOBA|nr:GTPase Obg [Geodia barretti]
MVRNELLHFNPELGGKRQLVVVNKLDVTEVREQRSSILEALKVALHDQGEVDGEIMFISAATGEGVDAMIMRIAAILEELPKDAVPDEQVVLQPAFGRQRREPESVRMENGVFVVESERLERLSALADTRDQRVLLQLWREMRRTGMADKLIDVGIEVGDTIRIGKVEVEWF